jgi:hypothetical protein
MKYRKKPVVIDAFQWKVEMGEETYPVKQKFVGYVIETLEGDMIVNDGDWIIRGIKGEYYPCKPDIFEATYEKVEDK